MTRHDARPDPDADGAAEHPFAAYVRTLGRGPARSRPLTRAEAADALRMILRGEADPHQVGAFMMLLRFRGENAEEIAGLADAARAVVRSRAAAAVDLDWPSYGAGRTRGFPWYLLSALALGHAGYRVLMHGSNAFTAGVTVADAMLSLGLDPAVSMRDAADQIAARGFAYLPLAAMSPELDRLLGLRALLGLRSPINTVARLMNPFDAPASVDGVFHPGYIVLHGAVASMLGQQRLLVLKGGGGEAERTAAKDTAVFLWGAAVSPDEIVMPAIAADVATPSPRDVWEGRADTSRAAITVRATIALGLLAMGAATPTDADARAAAIWAARGVLA